MEATIRRLKQNKRGVSNVIVVMLSLVLIVIIVGNVVLWSYQMNQLDLERMQETVNIANVTRITRSSWSTAQEEFSISAGSRLSGTYTDTKIIDDSPETFKEEIPSIQYTPSGYSPWDSTTFVSGSLTDLQTDNDVYIQFRSYPSTFSETTETFGNVAAGTSSRNTENTIVGSIFTPTKDGEAQSITAYIRMTSSSKNMKCAIYLHSNLSLVAQTEEKAVPVNPATWVTFNFLTPKPILKANTEYLLVTWSYAGNGYAYLYYTSGATNQGHYVSATYEANFPNPMPNPNHETRAYSIYCTFKPASEETVEVEFTGASNIEPWTNLTWTIDCSFTTDGVTTTFQLYNYQTGEYPTSGDGYMTDTIGTTDTTKNQTITTNPTNFRDADGHWKIKIKGVKATSTQFELKVDWIEFKTTLSDIYRLSISNNFIIDLSTYPLSHIHGIEIVVRYNVTEDAEKWFLKAYNWSASTFSDNSFNNTGGSQPTKNEWNEYAINITDNWSSYIRDDGTLLVEFTDEGLNATQTMTEIDFFAIRAIINGTRLDLKNTSPLTTHIIAIWVTNSTHHQRYNANLFINSGEEKTYIRADITLPEEKCLIKIVTERGNIAVFPVD
ncbi:MAG: hypothetical protein K6T73_00930 [Candidatus Bathyarchaeota archaeon]|nr:hypothetical protein [Candidatus Bathyarchaeota archaeon]